MAPAKVLRVTRLNQRESEVLTLLFEGLTNRIIGERLHLSALTVRDYVSRLLYKYEARNRTELVLKVIALRRHDHRRLPPLLSHYHAPHD